MPSITSFNQIRLSGAFITNSGNRIQVGSDNTLMVRDSGNFANLQYVTNISGALAEQISNIAPSGVSRLNGLSGSLNIVAASGNISLSISGSSILISDNRNDAINLSGNLATTGRNLFNLVTGLSGQNNLNFATISNLASTGQQAWNAANNNGINLSGNIATTGRNLFNLITGFSGQANLNFATIANLASTGQQAWNAANNNAINLSGNLTTTGTTLNNKINSLSGYAESVYVKNTTATGYSTAIITGFDFQYVNHPFAFSRIPQVQLSFDAGNQSICYLCNVTQRSTTGFFANFSDIVLETGLSLQVFASI